MYLLKSGCVKNHDLTFIERWPTKEEVMGSDVKYVCGMPPISEIGEKNVPEILETLYEETTHSQVRRGDIKEHLLAYTDIKFPAVNEKEYELMRHLRRGMEMLTFDRREEKNQWG